MKKTIVGIIAIFALTILLIGVVSSEFWACFNQGEVIHYCSDYKPPKTCGSSNGCQWCMSVYNELSDCYVHGVWYLCNQLTQECSMFDNNASIDSEPPEFTLVSPVQDSIYNSRKVLVEFDLNEKADVYYLDLINGRGKWTRVCSDCNYGYPSYSKARSFKEGNNDLQFKAVDVVGNPSYYNVSFIIDSQNPRIQKTNPRSGFANGFFEVIFKEDNPKELIIYYGDDNHVLNIANDCHIEKSKHYCEVFVDLSAYDGQEIEYWFTLEDVAGNFDDSKPRDLMVDMTPPVINNPGNFLNYEDGSKYVYFNLSIDEINFNEVVYSYYDDRGRLKEQRLCSRLKDGICYKKKSFKRGVYNLTVSVWDDAGNNVGLPANFIVDY